MGRCPEGYGGSTKFPVFGGYLAAGTRLAFGDAVDDECLPGAKGCGEVFGVGHEVRPAMSFAASEDISLKVAEERGKARAAAKLLKQAARKQSMIMNDEDDTYTHKRSANTAPAQLKGSPESKRSR
eukprot:12984416-Alexandrium_andersonii.AAC.1